MYKCFKCNKEFMYESKLNEHKKRKTECNKNNEFNCNICNKEFKYQSKLMEHEKTKKHINNINKINQTNTNGDNNVHIGDINNILNLTLNINAFKNTDTAPIKRNLINDIGYNIYLETINNEDLSTLNKVKKLFDVVLEILDKLHFSLDLEENHNLKILLIFPGIKKTVYEYLILEINPETKNVYWNSLKYEEMIKQILNHLLELNNKIENDNYDQCLFFLKRYLVTNTEYATELKPYIEEKLGELYISFNNKQKKESRNVENTFQEKVAEYHNYRINECKLNNGYSPEIMNSNIV